MEDGDRKIGEWAHRRVWSSVFLTLFAIWMFFLANLQTRRNDGASCVVGATRRCGRMPLTLPVQR